MLPAWKFKIRVTFSKIPQKQSKRCMYLSHIRGRPVLSHPLYV